MSTNPPPRIQLYISLLSLSNTLKITAVTYEPGLEFFEYSYFLLEQEPCCPAQALL